MIAELALRFPPGWQFAMASRDACRCRWPGCARRGASSRSASDDLAMSPDEAAACCAAGAAAGAGALDDLVDSTEGWPAGLYLAALAMRAGTRGAEAGSVTGDDGVRRRLPALRAPGQGVRRRKLAFLTRTSILDRMCGGLCAMPSSAETGSGRMLEQLESRNLLVVPLDRRREWYRYHHLFRELLHAELRRREPELVPQLHARAAAWYEANAMPEAAIEHARRPGTRSGSPAWCCDHDAAGVGQRPGRHGAALDGVARATRAASSTTRRIAAHGALDLRACSAGRARPSAGPPPPNVSRPTGDAARRQHDGGHAGLPARAPVPRRGRADAARRPARPWPGSARPARTGRPCCTPKASPTCSRVISTGPTRSSRAP